jgi:hypothetical protein
MYVIIVIERDLHVCDISNTAMLNLPTFARLGALLRTFETYAREIKFRDQFGLNKYYRPNFAAVPTGL